jgi:hypothetical protein
MNHHRHRNVYVATALENVEQAKRVASQFKAAGWHLTYDWTLHGSVQDKGEARCAEVSVLECQGVIEADLLAILMPGGRGTHTEFGIALATHKPILMFAPSYQTLLGRDNRVCSFYMHPLVTRIFGDEAEIVPKATQIIDMRWGYV